VTTDAMTFLSAWDGLELTYDGQQYYTFNALTNAFTSTGVADMLDADGGPYTIFAPTDSATAMVPADALAALLADPEALGALMLYHVLPEALTYDEMAEAEMLTAINGERVPFVASADDGVTFTYNGATISNFAIELRDGSLLYVQLTPQVFSDMD
jgi:uncharacterized surface protein with fasciclin (FAS1) repeats